MNREEKRIQVEKDPFTPSICDKGFLISWCHFVPERDQKIWTDFLVRKSIVIWLYIVSILIGPARYPCCNETLHGPRLTPSQPLHCSIAMGH